MKAANASESPATEDDTWERWQAEQEALGEVEAELRELAPDLGDDQLAAVGRRLLDRAWPAWHALDFEIRDRVTDRVVRRVSIRRLGEVDGRRVHLGGRDARTSEDNP